MERRSLQCLTKINMAHNDRITSLRFSDGVDSLASGSVDCLVKLWDVGKVPINKPSPPLDNKVRLWLKQDILYPHSNKVGSNGVI